MIITMQELIQLNPNIAEVQSEVEKRLPIIEDFIRDYTGNKFRLEEVSVTGNLQFKDNKITCSDVNFIERYFTPNSQIEVYGSIDNDGIYTVTAVSPTEITIDKQLVTENFTRACTMWRIAYPKALKQVVLDMVMFDVNLNNVDGTIKSESISRQSVTYNTNYPEYILDKLNLYCRVGW